MPLSDPATPSETWKSLAHSDSTASIEAEENIVTERVDRCGHKLCSIVLSTSPRLLDRHAARCTWAGMDRRVLLSSGSCCRAAINTVRQRRLTN